MTVCWSLGAKGLCPNFLVGSGGSVRTDSFGSSTSGPGTYPSVAYVTDFWSMGFMFLGDSLSWSQRVVVAQMSLDSFRMLQICGCVWMLMIWAVPHLFQELNRFFAVSDAFALVGWKYPTLSQSNGLNNLWHVTTLEVAFACAKWSEVWPWRCWWLERVSKPSKRLNLSFDIYRFLFHPWTQSQRLDVWMASR